MLFENSPKGGWLALKPPIATEIVRMFIIYKRKTVELSVHSQKETLALAKHVCLKDIYLVFDWQEISYYF